MRTGAAVFVGRASFRMIAGTEAKGIEEELSGLGTPTPVPLEPAKRWFAPVDVAEQSEAVVLTPPESVTRGIATEQVNEAAFGAHLDAQRRGPTRRATPIWAIAAAVIVGATATLFAQAVIRRPGGRPQQSNTVNDDKVLSAAHASSNTATTTTNMNGKGAGAESPAVTTALPAAVLAVIPPTPTVVPSTASIPIGTDHGDAKATLRLVVATDRGRPARVQARSLGRPSSEPRPTALAHPGTAPAKAVAWVDPFVDDTASASTTGGSAAPRRLPGGRRKTIASAQQQSGGDHANARVTATTWDDPFVK